MRALIEDPRVTTAWVLTCNYPSKLIEPLRSRLIEVEFGIPPSDHRQRHIEGLLQRCRQVLEAECVSGVSDHELRRVIDLEYPDLRKIITTLQTQFGHRHAA
jgi:DNA polymerase III delta prime subunit